MPSVSEMERDRIERLYERVNDHQLQSETETRRPMTGYESWTDACLIERIFQPAHPVANNLQLKRELKYRLIERQEMQIGNYLVRPGPVPGSVAVDECTASDRRMG